MKLKQKKKMLWVAFALFCLFQLFFIYKRIHNYPFMIYDMYSRMERPAVNSYQYMIITDEDTLDVTSLPIFTEGRLRNNLRIYNHHLLYHSDYWDPALTSRQERWTDGIMINSRLYSRSNELLRNSPDEIKRFPTWLKSYIENCHGTDIDQLRVEAITYDKMNDRITSSRTLINLQN